MADTRALRTTVTVLDKVVMVAAVVAGLMLAAQALTVTLDALLRGVATPLRWGSEVSTYLLLGEALLAAPYALRKGEHFRVTLLVERWSAGVQRHLTLALSLLAAAFLLVFAWQSADLALTSLDRDLRAPTLLHTPLVIPQMLLPVSAVLMVLALIAQNIDAFLTGSAGTTGEPSDEGLPEALPGV
ncbi:MAG: Tripartite ATP-independent periplasmic transporter DctQ component [Frankiales bacterium]|nr:Tripartite ATP-independent periplasmic transporter DctQ component [Frankiales bacterium]